MINDNDNANANFPILDMEVFGNNWDILLKVQDMKPY